MKITPTIFREYDIRGIVETALNEKAVKEYEKWYGPFPGITLSNELAKAIGGAYGTIIKEEGGKEIVVGYELRPGAEELKKAFVEGLLGAGANVTDAGIALTPIVYFHGANGGFDGAVNITGSHNVYFYNGFKLMKKNVLPLYGEEIQKLKGRIEKENYAKDQKGKYKTADFYHLYRDYLTTHILLEKKPKIVIDSGNGSAGLFAPQLFRDLGCEVIELYSEPDASFPNHVPDPEPPQNMKDLSEAVKKHGAELGIAFDADGDRVGFVDEKGAVVSADLITLILARDILTRNPGKKILFDVKSTQLLSELIPSYGGIPLMHRTGHGPIKATLHKDKDIIFGGEVSGHFFFVENYFRFDDGLWAAGQVLRLYSLTANPFSSLFNEIPKRTATPEIKLPCSDEIKFKIVEKIQNDLKDKYPSVTIDGIRISISKTAWGIIRASNTSPYLTVRAEAENEKELLEVKNILADELEKFPEIGDKLNRNETAALTGKLGWV